MSLKLYYTTLINTQLLLPYRTFIISPAVFDVKHFYVKLIKYPFI